VTELSREVVSSTNHAPSGERGYGDAPVLDLGVPVPGEGLVRGLLGEAERIPDLACQSQECWGSS